LKGVSRGVVFFVSSFSKTPSVVHLLIPHFTDPRRFHAFYAPFKCRNKAAYVTQIPHELEHTRDRQSEVLRALSGPLEGLRSLMAHLLFWFFSFSVDASRGETPSTIRNLDWDKAGLERELLSA
jgi:hypothetical protein